ncbi:MAG TPA: pyridoxamine 5'-phosphate oxidase family protein [Bacillota bacterium]|nr:pyridoxamine 5'-phosphate oxidase family protein [Bacillota bacterium]HOL09080.1 pyridoxamine 5'-phosphate oxidase family protein [Bacillota bacterium]HPO98042.1 pyridoxamine 5'-phosphate oxidase family protein [Bacillota bacterium]
MNNHEAITIAQKLVAESKSVLVGSNDEAGFPNIKAMFNLEHNGLKEFWFSTNTSSKRVAQFRNNSKASLYFVDFNNFCGLLLIGTMEVLQDDASRKRLWREGFEMYYPQGVDDPDYSVLKFTAIRGNIYHQLQNISFEL